MKMTGNTGFPASVICFLLVISGTPAKAVDNMDGHAEVTSTVIHDSPSLSEGEQKFIQDRKQIVLEALRKLEINCTEDSVPHIALLGSGGGQRAAVGMMGSISQMEKDGLLDTVLYLSGVSGSTWSMSTLYRDPDWSSNVDAAVSRLLGPGIELQEVITWLDKKAKEDFFSLSDVWGALTSAAIMRQMDQRHLSEEGRRNASNPYPIYGAVEKICFTDGPVEGKWFEVTPHKSGFVELDLFVDTSHLGSKFHDGELQVREPEMDMIQLQGVLGSALADKRVFYGYLPTGLRSAEHVDVAAEEYLRTYNELNRLVSLSRGFFQDPDELAELDKLQRSLEEKVNQSESTWVATRNLEERKSLSKQGSVELLGTVKTWGDDLKEGNFKRNILRLSLRVLPLIYKWEWGTTGNFLYRYQNATIPSCLQQNERFYLMDAGMLINVPYPSFLGDRRDIDLIIAPEYSAGNMFETLTLARKYAAQVKKPFPELDNATLAEKDWPRDFYVFEGKGNEPTIIYMPLFNRQNCKDEEEFKARMTDYSTFQRPYTNEMIESLLEVARTNMRNNKENLLREINKAALRRQNKRRLPEL